MERIYDCCEHCEHDINDLPHDRPCIVVGCEEAHERAVREFELAMRWAQDTWPMSAYGLG
jgi:hypothetical protein